MFDYLTINNIIALLRLVLDISIVWVVIYYCIKIVRNNSRTIQIFKGILLIFIIHFFATILGLKTVEALANLFVTWGFLAIIIIFQPEIRALLEKLGKTSVFSRISTLTINERERLVDELVKACIDMSKTKTGALISLEQGHSLSDFIKTGTQMNSVVTSELLCSIFVPGTPLHDGAVIIQGVKIACAAAYFPPTTKDFPSSYGARHRAAVGISEITDSVTIVVSEETGNISIAEGGNLTIVTDKALREYLLMIICQTQNEVLTKKISKQSDLEIPENIEKLETLPKSKTSLFAHYFKGKNKVDQEETKEKPKRFERKKKVENQPTEEVIETKEEVEEVKKAKKLAIPKLKKKAKKEIINEENSDDFPLPEIKQAEDIDTIFSSIVDDNKLEITLESEPKDNEVFKTKEKKKTKKSETDETKPEKKAKKKVQKVEKEESEKVSVSYKRSKKKTPSLNDEDSEGRDS
ncbi:MAG: diadenylate cyclase CdaA [Erysipelotrichaceae bacterium]